MATLDWLIARPLAHRGLHTSHNGVIENTASAFSAAIKGGYGIECDVQISADGEAMVHHDNTLDRLLVGKGPLSDLNASTLKKTPFKDCTDLMLTLGELCDLVDGRVTLLIEMKSHFDHDLRLPRRVADVLRSYSGPVAVMSFDPELILTIANREPRLAHGLLFERRSNHNEKSGRTSQMAFLLDAGRTRPQFIAYAINDLPAAAPLITRRVFGLPILAWTVRSDADRFRSRHWADQMIFEGWLP
jgi:glycerophosphoryl diester phosphodiesterase